MRDIFICFLKGAFTLLLASLPAFSQSVQDSSYKDTSKLTWEDYEVVYDDPFGIHRMFFQLHPLVVDMYVANPTIGYGASFEYRYERKADFKFAFRKAYGQNFDFMRENASKNKANTNDPAVFRHLDFVASIHIKDKERDGKTKIVPYRPKVDPTSFDNYKYFEMPCLVRDIFSLRTGAYDFRTAIDVSNAQSIQNKAVVDQFGNTPTTANKEFYFSNLQSTGIYLGGGYSSVRNVVVRPRGEEYAGSRYVGTDQILTTYFDLMISPFTTIEEMRAGDLRYNMSSLNVNRIGWRLGLDVMHNREFHWAFGVEIGSQTGIQGRNGFAVAKIAFPALSYSIDKRITKSAGQ